MELHFLRSEHVGDYFPCEYHDRTTGQQYSIAIGLVSSIFATKYVIEMKELVRGIITIQNDRVWSTCCDHGFLCDVPSLIENYCIAR